MNPARPCIAIAAAILAAIAARSTADELPLDTQTRPPHPIGGLFACVQINGSITGQAAPALPESIPPVTRTVTPRYFRSRFGPWMPEKFCLPEDKLSWGCQ